MTEHHDPSASVPSLHHPSYPSSLISWGSSEKDTPLYALALIQNPSVPSFILAQDIKNSTKLFGTDIIIAYGLSQIHQ